MNKTFKRFFILFIMVIIFLIVTILVVAKYPSKKDYNPKVVSNVNVGHIDIENQFLYVGYEDCFYETENSTTALGVVTQLFPESFGSTPEFSVIEVHYKAISSNGRFLVKTSQGFYWIKPKWKEYVWDENHEYMIVAYEKALSEQNH